MKPTTKLYVKTFLLTGLPFGLIVLGFDLAISNSINIGKYLFLVFCFGTVMSLILINLQMHWLKKSGVQKITAKNSGVNQTVEIKSDFNTTELIKKLKSDPIIGKMKFTEIENGVLLNTGITWKSWGEEIKISLKNHTEAYFTYQISSTPKLKTTLFDYGKNLENINQIKNALKR